MFKNRALPKLYIHAAKDATGEPRLAEYRKRSNISCACSILLIGSILNGSEALPSTVVELIAEYDNTPKIDIHSVKTYPSTTKGSSDSQVDIVIENEKEGFRIFTLGASQKYQRSLQDGRTKEACILFGKTFVPKRATASFFPHEVNSCKGTVVIATESKVTVYDVTNRYHDIDAALNLRQLSSSPVPSNLTHTLYARLTKAWPKSPKKSA